MCRPLSPKPFTEGLRSLRLGLLCGGKRGIRSARSEPVGLVVVAIPAPATYWGLVGNRGTCLHRSCGVGLVGNEGTCLHRVCCGQ